MKYTLLIAFTLSFLACQKSNLPTIEKWVVKQYKDHTTWDHAYACDTSDFIGIDTLSLSFNAAHDSTKFGLYPGSIYLPPNWATPTNDPDTFNRTYYKLVMKIK